MSKTCAALLTLGIGRSVGAFGFHHGEMVDFEWSGISGFAGRFSGRRVCVDISRRQPPGGMPVARVNTRVKWLWSKNPQSAAISASGLAVSASKPRASSTRWFISHRWGAMPVVSWKARVKWLRDREQAAATSLTEVQIGRAHV